MYFQRVFGFLTTGIILILSGSFSAYLQASEIADLAALRVQAQQRVEQSYSSDWMAHQSSSLSRWLIGAPTLEVSALQSNLATGTDELEVRLGVQLQRPDNLDLFDQMEQTNQAIMVARQRQQALLISGLVRQRAWDAAMARQQVNALSDKQVWLSRLGTQLTERFNAGELSRLVKPFLASASLLASEDKSLCFIAPMISEQRAQQFIRLKDTLAPNLAVKVIIGQTQQVMAASDCLLMASGTVSLEAALIKRPMVICYKFNLLTYLLAKWLVKLSWFSLPNLLANKTLVPELLQDEVNALEITPLLRQRLYESQQQLDQAFIAIHQSLKLNASEQAAKAVISVMTE